MYIVGDSCCTFSNSNRNGFYNNSNSRESGIMTEYDTWWMLVANTLGIKKIHNLSSIDKSISDYYTLASTQNCIESQNIIVCIMFESIIKKEYANNFMPLYNLLKEIKRIFPNGKIYNIEMTYNTRENIGIDTIIIPPLNDDEKFSDYPNRKGMYKIARTIIDKLLY